MVAVIAAIGATLPRDHVADRSLALRRPAEEVWPAIMQATRRVRGPGRRRGERSAAAPRDACRQTRRRCSAAPGRSTITPSPTGSTLTITEDGWVGNPIFRFVSRYVMGHHATMDGMLKAVAEKFGEQPELSGT